MFCIRLCISLLLATAALNSQNRELTLGQYLDAISVTPGKDIAEKVELLERMGVKLSSEGQRDLTDRLQVSVQRTKPTPQAPPVSSPIRAWGWRTGTFPLVSGVIHGGVAQAMQAPPTTLYNVNGVFIGSTTSFGNQSFHNLNNGLVGTTLRMGNQTVTSWSDGASSNTSTLGNIASTISSDGSFGSHFSMGNQTFHNYSDGTFSTTTTMGNQAVTTDSRGKTCTSTTVGNQVLLNCL